MQHYHIISAVGQYTPISSLKYDSYEDAVDIFVRLTVQLYGGTVSSGDLAIEHALEATKNNSIAYVGGESVALYFVPCQEPVCAAPTWN